MWSDRKVKGGEQGGEREKERKRKRREEDTVQEGEKKRKAE